MNKRRTSVNRSVRTVELLERRYLLAATLNINPTTHVLSYVDTAGIANDLTVEVIAGATPKLQFTEANTFDTVSLGSGAVSAGWTSPSAGVLTGPESSVSSMSIDTNDSSDTTVIKSTDVPVTIAPTNAGFGNEVDLGGANGDQGFTEGITAQVTVQNASGITTLVINDTGDATARQVAITDTGVSGLTGVPVVFNGSSRGVQIKTGTGGSTVSLNNASATHTWVVECGGSDTVNVAALAGASNGIVGGVSGGHVSLNVTNNGSLAGIKGTLILDTTDLFPSVTFDGSADTTPEAVIIDDTGNIMGLTPKPIQLGAAIITNLVVSAGGGGNTVDFDRESNNTTPFPANVTLNAGAGNDTVYVAQNRDTAITVNGQAGTDMVKLGVTPTSTPGTGSVTAFFGTTNITNAGGSNTIAVDDSSENFPHNFTVNDSGINGLTTTPITYSGVGAVSVIAGQQPDHVTILPSPTATFDVDAGSFNGSPTDTLFVNTSNALSPVLSLQNTANGDSGTYTFSNRKNITFARFGSVLGGISGAVVSILTGAKLPNAKVFLDLNSNGAADNNEPQTTTDNSGGYTFANLAPGNYQVAFDPQGAANQVAPAAPVTVSQGLVASATLSVAPPAVGTGPDLTATVATPTAGAVIAGAKGKTKVKITNNGTQTATGAIQLELLESTSSVLDGSAVQIGAFPVKKLKLKPGASMTVPVSFTYPTSLATGSYFTLVSADSTNVIAETNETNNVAASPAAVSVTAASIDLTGSWGKLKPSKAGTAASLPLTLRNLGNTLASGSIEVQVFSSADQNPQSAGSVQIFDSSIKINLKGHASKSMTLKIPAGKTVAGSRFLIALLNVGNTITETDLTNNTVVSGSAVTFS